MDPFAHGIDQAVAGREVLADTIGDVIVLPGVLGEGGKSQGQGEYTSKDQPTSLPFGAGCARRVAQRVHGKGLTMALSRNADRVALEHDELLVIAQISAPGQPAV